MRNDHPTNGASGFMCPRCGGALWEQGNGASPSFECRIGDRLSEAEVWIEHSAMRNRALVAASRAIAENAALARRLATSADVRGDGGVAARLREEAREEDKLYAQVRAALEGLPPAGSGDTA